MNNFLKKYILIGIGGVLSLVGCSANSGSISSLLSYSESSKSSSSLSSSEISSSSSDSSSESESESLSSSLSSSESVKLVSTNKEKYLRNEEVYIKASGGDSDWVGIYREDDDINSVDSIRWFYVNKNGFQPNSFYSVTKSLALNESRKSLKSLPDFKYKAVLFSNDSMAKSDYSKYVKEICYFEVLSTKIIAPNAPKKATYRLDNANDGLSNGKIELVFDDTPVNEVKMYWANSQGILDDYTALRTEKIYANPCTIILDDDSIIPSNATKLLIYSSNSAGNSSDCFEVLLADASQDSGFKSGSEYKSEFEVISDIHIAIKDSHLASSDAKTLHTEHLNEFVSDLANVNGDKKTPVIVDGDIANSGSKEEWRSADSILRGGSLINSVYYSLGNHDLYGGNYADQVKYFYEYAKEDSVYYKIEIDGYTHLFLGSENSESSVDASLSTTQMNWFKERMDEETSNDPSKPVFVHLHQSMFNTVAGSLPGQGWNGVTEDDAFRAIVSQYKQIFLFDGHSHWTMNSDRNHYKKDSLLPNIFNTGSVAYLWDSYNIPTGEYLKGSQGYYLKVMENCVYVLGRDFESNKFIPSACYRIDF